MKLELNQSEIEAALIEYVGSQGISISDKSISVDMVAGRGANGFTAHITIERDPPQAETNAIPAIDLSENTNVATSPEPKDSSPIFP